MDSSPFTQPPDFQSGTVLDADTVALIEFLSTRDVACPLCKYNLRGLTVARCPECGNTPKLTVGLVEVAVGAWVALITAILPASTFGLFFCLLELNRDGPTLRELERMTPGEMFLLAYAIFAIPTAIVLLVLRRRYTRLPRDLQRVIALIAIGVDLAGLLTVVSSVN